MGGDKIDGDHAFGQDMGPTAPACDGGTSTNTQGDSR